MKSLLSLKSGAQHSALGISSDYSYRGGLAMSLPDRFDWSLIGAILLVILILLVVVVVLSLLLASPAIF